MIENCPNCGKAPKKQGSCTYWLCECGNDYHHTYVSGPIRDESGEKWNEMVRRMRGNVQTAALECRTATACPECMRKMRIERAALSKENQQLKSEMRQLAELRDAIGDAWNKFHAASERLAGVVSAAQIADDRTMPPGMTWDELNRAAKVGDRATCAALGIDDYITKSDDPTEYLCNWKPKSDTSAWKISWAYQTDWRILPRDADA